MGFFEKKKTSLDYLKEISNESKRQSRAAELAAEAEQSKADAIVEAARERTRASLLLKDQANRKELSKQINELVFDPDNPKGIVSSLSFLCSLVDGWLGSSSSERRYRTLCKAAESKFKMGLTQLSIVDSSNAMMPYFKSKVEEFQEKRQKMKKHEIIKYSIPGGLFILDLLALCIYGLISDWELGGVLGFIYGGIFCLIAVGVMLAKRAPVDRDVVPDND